MENGQEQINNKTGRNVAKFAGCFIGTCLLSAALFLLWCGISYSMRLSVELIRVGITAWYALSGLIGGKILRACKCGAIPFCAVMLGGLFSGFCMSVPAYGNSTGLRWRRKPDDSDFVYGSGTAGKRAVEKEVRAV